MNFKTIFMAAALFAAAGYAAAADSPWGICCHPHSKMEWQNIDKQFKMMRDAGMTSFRHDMKFSWIARTKGAYDFDSYDKLLAKADEYGLDYLPILEGYDWEIEKSRPDAKPLYKHPEEWRKFVRACAAHYKGKLKIWEIWNEQDGGFWKPNPNAAQYVTLLKIAYEELKAADPENIVMVGGLCSWNTGYLRDLYAAGAKGYFDAIAVHPYNWGPDRSAFQLKRMAEFKQILAKNGNAGTRLWITECGGATHRSNLLVQQPDAISRAVAYAAEKIGRKLPEQWVVGAPVSLEYPDQEFEAARPWLPGARIVPVTPAELARLSPDKVPVFIGGEHVTVQGDYKEPMMKYLEKGGILLAFGDVPFYNIRCRNEQGNWTTRGAANELHPLFGIGFQAHWTKKGIPAHTSSVRTLEAGKEAGIADLSNVYVTRFLTADNLPKGGKYIPLVQALDSEGKSIGDGLALYTSPKRKGAILACTLQFSGGYSEEDQARLLQTIYLAYLEHGIERIYFYDFHNDGMTAAEKENNFGIVRWNYEPKPAYAAYREMTAALGKAPVFVKRPANLPAGVHALLFERAEGGKVLAAWSTGEAGVFQYEGREIKAGTDVTFTAL